jgi:two-component SAPR family response regulator
MIVQAITRVSLSSFRERSAGKKVVLLYPWTNYRNLFLTHFLSSAKEGLLYYRIPAEVTTLNDWLKGLVEEFDEVLGGFGMHLRDELAANEPDVLGEALAADLAAYSDEPIVLFIDELDRVPLDNNFRKFIQALITSLPNHVQVAFSSRLLTYQPWYDMVARGDAVVLGTEYRRNDVMFTVEDMPKPQLEVYALGRGYALVNGQQITNWDGALPRNLFFYFIDHPLVTRDEIFKTFWPDLSVKEATNVFHVTKRKISERISLKVGEAGGYELTQYSGGFYMPSDKVVRHYDAGDFQESVERALTTLDEREEELLLNRAIDLYKAPFLQTIEMKWTIERREQLRQLYSQALINMGRIQKRRENDRGALGFFVRALKETPEREDIHREVMATYLKLDMIDDARQQYNRLAQILNDNLGIAPSRESQALYELVEARR